MSGIGSGHNKFHTCKGCPDRTVEPNCHEACEGYIFRQKRQEEIRHNKHADDEIWRYKNKGRR